MVRMVVVYFLICFNSIANGTAQNTVNMQVDSLNKVMNALDSMNNELIEESKSLDELITLQNERIAEAQAELDRQRYRPYIITGILTLGAIISFLLIRNRRKKS